MWDGHTESCYWNSYREANTETEEEEAEKEKKKARWGEKGQKIIDCKAEATLKDQS